MPKIRSPAILIFGAPLETLSNDLVVEGDGNAQGPSNAGC